MEIEHFSHEHPLTLSDEWKNNPEIFWPHCEACWHALSDPTTTPTYGCTQCKYFIHKSCAELPRQIQYHPLHPLHPLTLYPSNPYESTICRCHACLHTTDGFAFHCAACKFDLDVDCAFLVPTVKYEGHSHLLALVEKMHHPNRKCKACYSLCDAFILRCVMCDINFHLRCFPSLPRTIKPECHPCPLTLTDSVEDNWGSIEFYCDVCEKKRDPSHPVYYCAECEYVAQIECVITEVLHLLSAKQESEAGTKEVEIKPASAVEGIVGATTGDELLARGVSAAMRSEEIGVGVTADPILAKLDGEITKLREEVEAVRAKLEALESERALCVASLMPITGEKCLREASTLE
ncbi:hypothetical protein L1049_022721 [Liquidambar formosana]|uniref:DC1 domain-containing protein n=1 Tax=Liquidambar formosana TaxID=63359 RepID=A0AAP0WPC0_LIQFO